MHLLGFYHEQSRTDRDENVRVNYENIDSQNWIQFAKFGFDVITDLGTPYDYRSLSHYGEYYYSK